MKNEKSKKHRSLDTGQVGGQVRNPELEEKHRHGYLRKPVSEGEFDVWEKEQKWANN